MRSELCWCGHVLPSHKSWANGLFCSNLGCGCREYAPKGDARPAAGRGAKRAGGEVVA